MFSIIKSDVTKIQNSCIVTGRIYRNEHIYKKCINTVIHLTCVRCPFTNFSVISLISPWYNVFSKFRFLCTPSCDGCLFAILFIRELIENKTRRHLSQLGYIDTELLEKIAMLQFLYTLSYDRCLFANFSIKNVKEN